MYLPTSSSFVWIPENGTRNLTSQQVPSEASLPSLGKNVSEHSAPCKEQQLDRAKPKGDSMEGKVMKSNALSEMDRTSRADLSWVYTH